MIATKINARSGIAPMRSSALTVSTAQPVMATPLAVAAGVSAVAAAFTAGIAIGVAAK
jgi:hypothetical protein